MMYDLIQLTTTFNLRLSQCLTSLLFVFAEEKKPSFCQVQ